MHPIGTESPELNGAQAVAITYLPTWDRVLVVKHPDKDKTARGLFLPQNFQGNLTEGTILAVGPGRITDVGTMAPGPFAVGQVVLFSDQSALCVDNDDPSQVMVASQAILAVKA